MINPYCSIDQALFKICTCKLGVPLNIDLLCGLVIIFLCGLLQVLTIQTDHNCFKQKSAHLAFISNRFYNLICVTVVITTVLVGKTSVQNFLNNWQYHVAKLSRA